MKLIKPLSSTFVGAACAFLSAFASACFAQSTDLKTAFLHPSAEARPQVWWHWMNGNITREGIRKDLNWMHDIGLGGVHIFDAGFSVPRIVKPRVAYMTAPWKDCFAYALHLADSLGMEVTLPSSPGWSNTGGPWVPRQDAMKRLTWRLMVANGGRQLDCQLPEPFAESGIFQNTRSAQRPDSALYRDIACVAVRMAPDDVPMAELHPTATCSGGTLEAARLYDDDLRTMQRIGAASDGSLWVDISFPRMVTIRALSMCDGRVRDCWDTGDRQHLYELQASADGVVYNKVCDVPQGGAPLHTFDIPPTTARSFRLVCHVPEQDGAGRFFRLAELSLSTVSRVQFAEEKSGFATFGDLPDYPTPPTVKGCELSDVVDVTPYVADGHLRWRTPKGRWRIYRFGWALTGKLNHPASPEGTGLEVDKMDRESVHRYLEHYLQTYADATGGKLGPAGISHLLIDSYEAGSQTWTPLLPLEFARRRGYALVKWLPALAGEVLVDGRSTDAFLTDFRRTLGDLYTEHLYAEVSTVVKSHSMGSYFESDEGRRQYMPDGISVKRWADIPMGAMWMSDGGVPSINGRMDIKESSSTAHLYGKRLVAGESFTADGRNGREHSYWPGNIKPVADCELAYGLNRFVIHESAHQPDDVHRPGLALGIYGQWFNRHETWASMAKPWISYLTRSASMMQQGQYVADVAYFYGEDNNITGIFINNQPPVPQGYAYDFLNAEALQKDVTMVGGWLQAPSGMTYRVLALDKQCRRMTLASLRRLQQLVNAGCKVWGQKPQLPMSLEDDTLEFARLTADIWEKHRSNVMATPTLEEAFKGWGIRPDCSSPDMSQLSYVHRHAADGDFYWVSNTHDSELTTTVSLRTTGRKPEIWHADDGRMEPASYVMKEGRTEVSLSLEPHDAVFIVLREPTDSTRLDVPQPRQQQLIDLSTGWTAQFLSGMGAPATVSYEQLTSWTESADSALRYYSGTALYSRSFKLRKLNPASRYVLHLGRVGVMAEVEVNGITVGTAWKQPYALDVSRMLRKGRNEVRIRVVNLWPNRIIGDLQPSAHRYTWSSFCGFKASSPLLPSGMMGPVQLEELH